MSKILYRILLTNLVACCFLSGVNAQFNNSWIDYSKTYYKFRIAKDSLCRIPQSAIAAAGLQSVNADHFQLWRNGKEVRLYTSVSNAALSPTDFIEFWGKRNDGKADLELYRQPDFQLADKYSLETDTVAYFLTVNPAGNNLRYQQTINPAPGLLVADPYYIREITHYFNNQIHRGEAKPVGEYVYSSAYDPAEGWSSNFVSPSSDLLKEFSALGTYTTGPVNTFTVKVNAAGAAPNTRDLRIRLGQTEITTAPYSSTINMPYFEYRKVVIPNLPLSLIPANNNLQVYVNGNSSNSFDRIIVASIGIRYPAQFNFGNSRYFSFNLLPASGSRYLVIDNFNYGAQAPVLYDQTNGFRYVGDITSTPGKVKFVLPQINQETEYLLMSQDNLCSVTNMQQRNFVNYNISDQQGNYMIISNSKLFDDGSGINYVDQYRNYRTSGTGGGYVAKVYDIDELTDQFAFGIKHHPAAVRDFVRFAKAQFVQTPLYVFIIGRGVNYSEHRSHESDPISEQLNLVTTFGWPASDVLLVSEPGKVEPVLPVGRLAAISPEEVSNYLTKIQEYESAQQVPSPVIGDKFWMKNFIHVVGGKDSIENQTFRSYMDSYKQTAEDTLMGAHVETFTKTSTGAIQQANSERIEELFNEGLGFIGYFGHSSANTFEFNLSNPEIYQNAGKYPFFNVSGCSAGNYYIFDPTRLNGNLTLSEKYVLANQRGSIGFLADTHFGIPPFLNFYNGSLYTAFSKTQYGQSVGKQIKSITAQLGGSNPGLDFFTRIHLEEINLHGDPAISINNFAKPDFAIEEPMVKISPDIISVADDNFNVSVKMRNIGRAVSDSIIVTVKRKLPNDTIRVLYQQLIPSIENEDSINLTVPINFTTDKGLNQIMVQLDVTNRVEESFESNNAVTKDFYIFEDELRPIYPYDFAIVNRQNITYSASTANPLSGTRDFVMEIDTTALFNSPFKKVYNQSGLGGIVSFTPSGWSFSDNTVYYWRVSMVPRNGGQLIWNNASFVYLNNSSSGFNLSHYYQHKQSTYNEIDLADDRVFRFKQEQKNLIIRTGLYPYYDYDRINVNLDFTELELYGCVYNALQFYVFDTATLMPWRNYNVSPTNARYGSYRICLNAGVQDTTRKFFEYPYSNATYRKKAMDFIDSIPDGMYVAITNLGNKLSNNSFIQQWKNDTLTLGSGNSLYHKLKSIGFTQIDSFRRNLPFLYFFRKGRSGFTPTQVMGAEDSSYIDQTFNLPTTSSEGTITSPVLGPASVWTSLHWRGGTSDPLPGDTVKIAVWGVRNDGVAEQLATMYPSQDTSLNFVNPQTHPFLQLQVQSKDNRFLTPDQLRYLRINASLVPEGAVAPAILYSAADTVEQGQPLDFKLTFKNISDVAFDSMIKVKFIVTDRYNVPHEVTIPKRKTLPSGDTINVIYSIDTRDLVGSNTLYVEFNPDNDQPEQYHFNNFLYKTFFVRADDFHPLLDVTFDGVHILNRDIVSSRPNIHIRLKDESKYLALADTSLLKVQVRFPDQSLHTYPFGDTMVFHPADLSTGDNTASIDMMPYFAEDGDYELIVTGKDAVGNSAGDLDYHVVFSVINKPMISNMLNYPNPFTTSTAFVFTITGSQVPQNIRIQILTITGKVVREITKDELGPLHIGRNITDFKWDGTDQFGQKLANGVYLYRVLTNHNGKRLDKYTAEGDRTDQYFNKGYGKMYLMR